MEKLMTSEAEKYNGWAAMLGFVVAIGTYAITGQIIPEFSRLILRNSFHMRASPGPHFFIF